MRKPGIFCSGICVTGLLFAAGSALAVCWEQYDSNSCDWVIQMNHDPSCGPANPYWYSPVTMVLEAETGRQLAASFQEQFFCAVDVLQKDPNTGVCKVVNIQTTDTISQKAYGPPCYAPFPE